MGGVVTYLFGAASFVPHGYCLLWRPDLVALHAVADVATAIAYFSIPAAILVFMRRRPDFDHPQVAMLFAIFILGCGLTHVADLTTLWWPVYGLQGLLKAGTAIASILTAAVVWRLLPRVLLLPSPAQLRLANDGLTAEIARRAAAEAALVRARDQLEAEVAARTEELALANRRLEAEVAERRQAEQAARDGEARLHLVAEGLRLAVEATDLGIWDVDVATGSRHWSAEHKRILGLPADAKPDSDLFVALIHPEDRARACEHYHRAYGPMGSGRLRSQFRIRRADDGMERWVEATGQIHYDAHGRARRGVGTLADVTERRRAEQALQESEERYRALVETAPDGVLVYVAGRIVIANRRAAVLFGATRPADLIGCDVFDLVDEGSRELARARSAELVRADARVAPAELSYRRLDGTPFPVESTAAAVLMDGSLAVQIVFRDITERRRAERALRARTAELETVLETVPLAVWVARGPHGEQIEGNRHATATLRLASHDNQSLTAPTPERPAHFRVFRDGDELQPDELPLQRATRGEIVRNEELRIVFDDGTFHDELISATPIRDAGGAVTGAVGAAIDITERKSAEQQMRHLALHDPLTGLPNRALFQDRLGHALARARRGGGRVAVMLLDLDNFKDINDAFGHSIGDALLRAVATRLSAIARASDTWARLGGDEFALVQEGLQEEDAADAMAARVLAALEAPFQLDGDTVEVSCSLGATIFPTDADTPERLMRNADVALYRAKAAGRGRFEPYSSELDRELRLRRALQHDLRQAIEQEALELLYQPMFGLADGRLVKVEALLRWPQADGGCVAPAVFIPIAESSGLIHALGERVLAMACRQGARWCAAGNPLKVAVNVSAIQLRNHEFPKLVRRCLELSGMAPELLELELTESVFLDAAREQIHETLNCIAAMGVTLAIDDFGTGYSSLAYLRHFPFDDVKIDRSFVADIGHGLTGGVIATAVIGLAHSLGKRVTAEGVETAEQLEFLRQVGCDAAQGYLFARPCAASSLAGLQAAAA